MVQPINASTTYKNQIREVNHDGVFVDPSWSGTESGTYAEPFSSLLSVTAASTVYIKCGTTETFTSQYVVPFSGMTYKSYGSGAKPKLIFNCSNSYGFRILNVSDVTLDGLEIYSTLTLNGSTDTIAAVYLTHNNTKNITISNCDIHSARFPLRSVNEVTSVKIYKCNVYNAWTDCMYFGLINDCEISYCNIYDPDQGNSQGDCMQFYGDSRALVDNYIHHNVIDHSNSANKQCIIYSQVGTDGSVIIEDNTIIGGSNTGILVIGSAKIRRNKLFGVFGTGMSFGNTTATQAEIQLESNFVHTCVSSGIIAASGDIALKLQHNTVYNTIGVPYSHLGTGSVLFTNNICRSTITATHTRWDSGVTVSSDYNVYNTEKDFIYHGTTYNTLALYQAGSSQDANSIILDPDINTTTFVPGANGIAIGSPLSQLDDSNIAAKDINGVTFGNPSVCGAVNNTSITSLEVTHKDGNIVYLYPNNLGVYPTAAAAIADVPVGGTLMLMQDYDVNVHGTITVNKPITIRGTNWGRTEDNAWGGTRILNTTSPDANAIVFSPASTGGSAQMLNIGLHDLLIEHNGSGYAVDLIECAWGELSNLWIDCNSTGLGGIRQSQTILTLACFWMVYDRVSIRDFTSRGVFFDDSRGSKNIFRDGSIRSSVGTSVCGIEISAKDTTIVNSQVDCEGGPSIRVVATTDRRPDGVIIDNVLSEENFPLVEITRTSGTDLCKHVIVRNPVFSLEQTQSDREFVVFDYAENCILEMPVDYGATTRYGPCNLFTCTANSKGNLIKLSGWWTTLPFSDLGTNNRVEILDSTDKQLMDANVYFPTSTDIVAYSNNLSSPVVRSAQTNIDGISGVWDQPGVSNLKSPNDITGLVAYLDASKIDTMWSTAARDTTITDTDSVLFWDDVNTALYFDNIENIDSITPGTLTTIELLGTQGSALQSPQSVVISNVTINAGPDINGTHTIAGVTDHNTFIINFNSTGGSYTGGTYTYVPNTPEYTADVEGLGIPGVYFDGSVEYLRSSAAIELGVDTNSSIFSVVTPKIPSADDQLRPYIGRYWGTIGMRASRYTSSPDNVSLSGLLDSDPAAGYSKPYDWTNVTPIASVVTRNGTSQTYQYNMTDDIDSQTDDTTNHANETFEWSLGAAGTPSIVTGTTKTFMGYIHAICIFNKTLSDSEIQDLYFYFMNKFKAGPVA